MGRIRILFNTIVFGFVVLLMCLFLLLDKVSMCAFSCFELLVLVLVLVLVHVIIYLFLKNAMFIYSDWSICWPHISFVREERV